MASDIFLSKASKNNGFLTKEKEKIKQYISKIQNNLIRDFLSQNNLPQSGNKNDLLKRIDEALDHNLIQYSDLTKFLDKTILCGKQHIYLYDGSENIIERWKNEEFFTTIIEKKELAHLINSYLPIILPNEMELSTLIYDKKIGLEIIAIHKRISWERNSDLDEIEYLNDSDIRKDAYVQTISRGVIRFKWDFVMNQAQMQIS